MFTTKLLFYTVNVLWSNHDTKGVDHWATYREIIDRVNGRFGSIPVSYGFVTPLHICIVFLTSQLQEMLCLMLISPHRVRYHCIELQLFKWTLECFTNFYMGLIMFYSFHNVLQVFHNVLHCFMSVS